MNTDTNSNPNFTGTPHTDPTNADEAWSIGGLLRVSRGRMVGGVAAGIGRAVNVNPLLIRIALVVATLWFEGLPILIYIALWMLIGTDTNPISPLQRWLSNINTGYQAPADPGQPHMAQPNMGQPNPWQYSGPAAPQAPYSPPAPQPPAPTAPVAQPAAPTPESQPAPAAEAPTTEAAAPAAETTSTDEPVADTAPTDAAPTETASTDDEESATDA